jgi:hypothetical protein
MKFELKYLINYPEAEPNAIKLRKKQFQIKLKLIFYVYLRGIQNDIET